MLQASKTLGTSALSLFVPRQVMLDSKSAAVIDSKNKDKEMEKENKKKKSKSKPSQTLENGSNDPKIVTLADDGAKRKSRRRLLSSIVAFLESNGFHKTLSVFRSEAQIESDNLKASCISLEDMFVKFLETSRGHEEAAINCLEEKGPQITDSSNKDEIEHVHDAPELIHKKKRKHRKEYGDASNPGAEEHELDKNGNGLNSLGTSDGLEKLKSSEVLPIEIKDKKKKKKKKSSTVPLEENAENNNLESSGIAKDTDQDSILPSIDPTDKAKKKKKNKMSSDGCDGNAGSKDQKEKFQEIVKEKIAELNSLTNMSSTLPAESNAKHKGEKKKKKKTEAGLDSLSLDGNKYTTEGLKESESVKETAATSESSDKSEKKTQKKRKRLDSKERGSEDENGTMTKESSKHVKLEGAENSEVCGIPQKPDSEHTTVCKKRKTKHSSESSDKVDKASHQEQESTDQNVQKELGTHQLANGEPGKNEERRTTSKSKKNEKHSAEPKTVNAFQRVKIDEVKFADERLQDNSYWALDDTGSGYGAKAQEVLGQVRGRGFRHEKTKKKRGTYRGGQIDLQSHSIKFNYSDEE